MRYAEEVDFGAVIERGARAVEGLPAALVYAGFSLGVLPAQKLAQTRAGARRTLVALGIGFEPTTPGSEDRRVGIRRVMRHHRERCSTSIDYHVETLETQIDR